MASKAPIELMSARPHPFSSLSRMFRGFCDPENSVDREEEQRTDEHPVERRIKSTAIAPEPAQQYEPPPPKAETSKEVIAVVVSQELQFEASIPPTRTPMETPKETQEKEPLVVTVVKAPEVIKKPVSILKTSQKTTNNTKKKNKLNKNAVAVESGKKERVSRILETSILTVVFLVATIIVLRSLGHSTDSLLSFGKSAGALSSPITFDVRTSDPVKKAAAVEVEAKITEVPEPEETEQETTMQTEEEAGEGVDDGVATSDEGTMQTEEEADEGADDGVATSDEESKIDESAEDEGEESVGGTDAESEGGDYSSDDAKEPIQIQEYATDKEPKELLPATGRDDSHCDKKEASYTVRNERRRNKVAKEEL
eukprot:CAMPEP_0119014360 /NCGR_PEP_ID=MMETSP1176-20130426/9577_1 /TAXON_ID=265551 /ORGANISM="Synedropsis recta cf, Strain CCMP1620" /LENGTH=368 /DNA_ID=CAMNT_0006967517 /DNA_START=37 /DNA_END=1144 /DNA_ORIENTATION=+